MEGYIRYVIELLKKNKIVFSLGLAGVFFVIFGIIQFVIPGTSSSGKDEATRNKMTITENKSTPQQKKQLLYVDVSGAVNKPGVYLLESANRIQDALLAAGGLAPNADRLRVSQTINLAAKLTDGTKLYIPTTGEQFMTSQSIQNGVEQTSVMGANTGTMNINQASESELDSLPGIGEITAGKIIKNRPYQSINELVEKKVIGASVFEKIKGKISIY